MLDEGPERSLFLDPPPATQPSPPPEPPAGPAAPLVEVEGGRRRWLQVLVVLAVLVGGVVANRTSAERAADEEATLEQPAPLVAPGEPPAALAQSLRTIERLGPLLPEPTGTTLVLAAGTQVLVLDIDSGTVRGVQLADLEVTSSYPWGSPVLAVGDSIVVRSQPPGGKVIPRTDGGPVRELDVGSGGGLYPSTEEDRYWVEELRGEGRLEEVDLAGSISRTVPVPGAKGSIVWDGAGFVQTVDGTAFGFPLDGGAPTPLGSGSAIAADARSVALLRCPEGSAGVAPAGERPGCELVLLDRASGTVRPVPRPEGTSGFVAGPDAGVGPTLSSDGRWLLVRVDAPDRPNPRRGGGAADASLAVVDVGAGTVRAVEPGAGSGPPVGAFSPDGRWLFLGTTLDSVSAELSAVRLADGARFDLDVDLAVRASFGLVLEGFPSAPADRGAEG